MNDLPRTPDNQSVESSPGSDREAPTREREGIPPELHPEWQAPHNPSIEDRPGSSDAPDRPRQAGAS